MVRQNLELPGGRVDQGARELVLRTMGRVDDTAGFRQLIVANQNGYPVRIKDIGRVNYVDATDTEALACAARAAELETRGAGRAQ